MEIQPTEFENIQEHDQDIKFEKVIDSGSESQTSEEGKDPKPDNTSSTIPGKEDTLGNSDFPPLSEKDKLPKLPDDERIKELNRKTSLGD